MASYGCLHEWAQVLGNQKAADLLEEILNEEKAANEALTKLALSKSNAEALGEAIDPDPTPGKTPKPSPGSKKNSPPPRRGMRPMTSAKR